jgi:hypothetical protein
MRERNATNSVSLAFWICNKKRTNDDASFANTHYCHGINETIFLQGCLGYYHIIPVTLFLTTPFNACMTYQEDKTMNLLISALNCFDIGAAVHDEIFMNTLGMITIFALISKLEFHAKLTRSPLHLYLQLDYPGTSTMLL